MRQVRFTWFLLISFPAFAQELSLAGQWRFEMDPEDVGKSEAWFKPELPGTDRELLFGACAVRAWTKGPANPILPKSSGSHWDRDGTWDPFVLYEDGVFKGCLDDVAEEDGK